MIVAMCDGCSKGNPGAASYAVVIWERLRGSYQRINAPSQVLTGKLGIKTNHEAEWHALIEAMRYINKINKNNEDVYLYNDSMTVINVAVGKWKCRSQNMGVYLNEFIRCGGNARHVHVCWVPRQMLYLADKYANSGVRRHETNGQQRSGENK